MNRHFLGFGLFLLIVGTTVSAGAFFYKLSKPLREIPVSTVETIPPYTKKTSCDYDVKVIPSRVTIDLSKKKIFTEVASSSVPKNGKMVSQVTEIYEEGVETRIFSTFADSFKEENSRLSAETNLDFYRQINPRKNYYARVWLYETQAEESRLVRHLLAENIPVSVFAGKTR